MKTRIGCAGAAGIVVLAGAAFGQAPADVPPSGAPATTAADWNRAIAPFVEEDTFAIGHADLSRIDTVAITNYLLDIGDAAKVPAGDPSRKEMAAGLAVAGDFMGKCVHYGVHDVYAVWDHEDAMNLSGPAILIPIDAKGNAAAMTELLKSTFGKRDFWPGIPVAAINDHLLVFGGDAAIKRIQGVKPSPRPDLQFRGGRESVFASVVASPTADERRALAELQPVLPPEFGGGSTQWLSHDLQNLTLEITLPPKPHAELTFGLPTEPPPAGGAGSAAGTYLRNASAAPVDAFFKGLRESKEYHDFLTQEITGPDADQSRTLLTEILTPRADVMTLSDAQVQTILAGMLRGQAAAIQSLQTAQAEGDVKGLVVYCLDYAKNHGGRWPETLNLLVDEKQVPATQLLDVRDPGHRPFAYQPPPANAKGTVPVVWEGANVPGTPRIVGYSDGHVALVQPEDFQSQLPQLAPQKGGGGATQPAPAVP